MGFDQRSQYSDSGVAVTVSAMSDVVLACREQEVMLPLYDDWARSQSASHCFKVVYRLLSLVDEGQTLVQVLTQTFTPSMWLRT